MSYAEKKQGCTVLIVSHGHRMRQVADRVLSLEDGRFQDTGKMGGTR